MFAKLFQSCPTLCNPMDLSPPGSSVHGDSPGRNWSGLPCPPPGDLPNPGIEPASLISPALANRHFTTRVREGHGNSLQYSCLKNPMDRESGGPQSMELQRVGYDCSDLACMHTWTAAHQASLSFIISRSLLKLMSIELVMPSNYLILCRLSILSILACQKS